MPIISFRTTVAWQCCMENRIRGFCVVLSWWASSLKHTKRFSGFNFFSFFAGGRQTDFSNQNKNANAIFYVPHSPIEGTQSGDFECSCNVSVKILQVSCVKWSPQSHAHPYSREGWNHIFTFKYQILKKKTQKVLNTKSPDIKKAWKILNFQIKQLSGATATVLVSQFSFRDSTSRRRSDSRKEAFCFTVRLMLFLCVWITRSWHPQRVRCHRGIFAPFPFRGGNRTVMLDNGHQLTMVQCNPKGWPLQPDICVTFTFSLIYA